MSEGMPKPSRQEQKPADMELSLESDAEMNARLGNTFPEAPATPSIELAEGIATAESQLGGNLARLKDNLNKPESAPEKIDTFEKIQENWKSARLKALGAFTALFGAAATEFIAGAHFQSVVEGTKFGIGVDSNAYDHATSMVQTLSLATEGTMIAAAAVPLLMLAYSKISNRTRERKLNAATA